MVVDVLRVGGCMKWRTFISGVTSGLLAAPLAAEAQEQKARKVYRIGFLRAGQAPKPWVEAFQQGLRERGYVDGQNVVVEFRFTDGSVDQLPRLAEELVRLKVDVILASAAPPALAAKKATTSVPIVFVNVFDPVELGLIPSLGRPGGNITGLATTLRGSRREAPGAAQGTHSQAQASRCTLGSVESDQPDTAQGGGDRGAYARPAASTGASPGPERLRRCIQS
jgi:ABC transporter substrate binding protein